MIRRDLTASVYASVEAGNVRHEHEWRVWKEAKLPDGKLLIPGVVSHDIRPHVRHDCSVEGWLSCLASPGHRTGHEFSHHTLGNERRCCYAGSLGSYAMSLFKGIFGHERSEFREKPRSFSSHAHRYRRAHWCLCLPQEVTAAKRPRHHAERPSQPRCAARAGAGVQK